MRISRYVLREEDCNHGGSRGLQASELGSKVKPALAADQFAEPEGLNLAFTLSWG